MSINKVILLGRLTNEPKLNYTENGTPVCTFSIATNTSYKTKSGEKKELTQYHNMVVWNKLGETCNTYLKMGRQAFFEGRIEYRSYIDKKTDVKKYITEINVSTVEFLGGGDSKKDYAQKKQNTFTEKDYKVDPNPAITADDIPF